VQAAELLDSRALLAGSGALAGEIAGTLPIDSRSEKTADEQSTESGRVLLVIGSANAVTERQLNHLLQFRPVVTLEAGAIIDREALRSDSHVLLRVKPGSIADYFIGVLSALLGERLRGLVLSGGDTAEAVMRCLNASGIRLGGEVVPGVPWGHIIGGAAAGFPVATKSGGFGADEALVKAVDFLEKLRALDI
jgi:uncharacterized protein YgbK (DUF1537 family)